MGRVKGGTAPHGCMRQNRLPRSAAWGARGPQHAARHSPMRHRHAGARVRTSAAAEPCCLSLHASTTVAPRSASLRAVERPMPRLPPVTIATTPSRGCAVSARRGVGVGWVVGGASARAVSPPYSPQVVHRRAPRRACCAHQCQAPRAAARSPTGCRGSPRPPPRPPRRRAALPAARARWTARRRRCAGARLIGVRPTEQCSHSLGAFL